MSIETPKPTPEAISRFFDLTFKLILDACEALEHYIEKPSFDAEVKARLLVGQIEAISDIGDEHEISEPDLNDPRLKHIEAILDKIESNPEIKTLREKWTK